MAPPTSPAPTVGAAGLAPATPATLADADRVCRRISRQHGVSYYWASQLLAPEQRCHVHALYALCRRADDVVDATGDVESRRAELAAFRARFDAAVADGTSDEPVLFAAARTVRHHRIEPVLFDRFFAAMAADLDTAEYETWDDLLGYMDGSAAVIGELLLPILDPVDASAALEPARSLGLAFQLTNFLRDIDEDLDLGRQYLPQSELRRFGVDLAERRVTPEFTALMRFQIDRCRHLYEVADRGVAMLPRRSARCVWTARQLYSAILERIEDAGYDVFSLRASVPTWRKLAVAGRAFVRR